MMTLIDCGENFFDQKNTIFDLQKFLSIRKFFDPIIIFDSKNFWGTRKNLWFWGKNTKWNFQNSQKICFLYICVFAGLIKGGQHKFSQMNTSKLYLIILYILVYILRFGNIQTKKILGFLGTWLVQNRAVGYFLFYFYFWQRRKNW